MNGINNIVSTIGNTLYPNFNDPTSWGANFWTQIIQNPPEISGSATISTATLSTNGSATVDLGTLAGVGVTVQSGPTTNNTFLSVGLNKYFSIGVNSNGVVQTTVGLGIGSPVNLSTENDDYWEGILD